MLRAHATSSAGAPGATGPPSRATRESPITTPRTPDTVGPTGDGVTWWAPVRSVSERASRRPWAPTTASTPLTPHTTRAAASATTVERVSVRERRRATTAGRAPAPERRTVNRSIASTRSEPTSPQMPSTTATRISVAQPYQCSKPVTIAESASAGLRPCARAATASPAVALRCTGPIVSCGRSGP